ncbi:branched-chain amino acid transport system ATP-binding protein [Actinocorallia herbida]|uniref:Branched-chain amino acid transport system ATP-binding protein n=1 Tax=Actinocorallia herbida TaxID=58109 RepID=A0A3N1CVB1_9ACTN|nr:ABC transporter ATP-binding protein [Actinocorallia herbida]ROO85239.1 branched-chain amino acid transport system ATP-binding protein [Actinocorallia herbida]
MAPVLELSGVHAGYGGVKAVRGVDLTVGEGEFVVLLGPNGAGKSTTLRVLSGLLKPSAGVVRLSGRDITRVPGHRRPALGLGHVPEGRQIFPDHTVLENLRLGAFGLRRDRTAEKRLLTEMLDLFPRLAERRDQRAGTLSGGEAQMLAVARALMSRPKLLVLDEPTLGLAPLRAAEVFTHIKRLNTDQGLPILLVEQLAMVALKLADRAYVLERGTVALSGPAAEVAADPAIQSVYLGADTAP